MMTRRAVELALDGEPVALRLCIERILPPCRERPVRFVLPPIESAGDVSAAMNAVTSALARGTLTPGEAERIAIVVETFARAIDRTKRRELAVNPLQIWDSEVSMKPTGVIPTKMGTAILWQLMSTIPGEQRGTEARFPHCLVSAIGNGPSPRPSPRTRGEGALWTPAFASGCEGVGAAIGFAS
jgi:hypothetical protein